MIDPQKLEEDIQKGLQKLVRPGREYRNPYQAIFKLDARKGFRSDGMLACGDILIAIEIETGQRHPDTNVTKYWYLLHKKIYRKIFLFHYYTHYPKPNPSRKELADYLTNKLRQKGKFEIEGREIGNSENHSKVLREIMFKVRKTVSSECK